MPYKRQLFPNLKTLVLRFFCTFSSGFSEPNKPFMKITARHLLFFLVLPLFLQCKNPQPSQDLKVKEDRIRQAIKKVNQLGSDQKTEALARLKAIENELRSIDRDSTKIKIIDDLAAAHLKLGDTVKFHSLNERLLSYKSDPFAAKAVVWYHYNLEDLYLNRGELDQGLPNYRSMQRSHISTGIRSQGQNL